MQLVYIAMAFLVVLLLLFLVVIYMTQTSNTANTNSNTNSTPVGPLQPSKFSLFNRVHYYQVPPNPKGTFVFLHGCARSATGYWPPSPGAPECTGFPEDVSHTKQILRAGYALLAPTPQSSDTCFSASGGDFDKLIPIIEKFWSLTGLGRNKPLYMGGASAGGSVAVRFPKYAGNKLRIDGMLLEVSTNQTPLDDGKPSIPNFPPTVWVVMERDLESQREARAHATGLTRAKIGAAVVLSPIRKVTDAFFAERMVDITPAESKKIVQGLKAVGIIDAGGNFTRNPHDNLGAWMNKLKPHMPPRLVSTLGMVRKSTLYQALAVAYARHETVGDYTTAAIKFFEAGGKADMKDLVSKHQVWVPAKL